MELGPNASHLVGRKRLVSSHVVMASALSNDKKVQSFFKGKECIIAYIKCFGRHFSLTTYQMSLVNPIRLTISHILLPTSNDSFTLNFEVTFTLR